MPHMEDSKKELIKKNLLENPLMKIDDLDRLVQDRGLTGFLFIEKYIAVFFLSRTQKHNRHITFFQG